MKRWSQRKFHSNLITPSRGKRHDRNVFFQALDCIFCEVDAPNTSHLSHNLGPMSSALSVVVTVQANPCARCAYRHRRTISDYWQFQQQILSTHTVELATLYLSCRLSPKRVRCRHRRGKNQPLLYNRYRSSSTAQPSWRPINLARSCPLA